LEGLWGGQERSEGPVKRSGKVWRVCEEVAERGGGSFKDVRKEVKGLGEVGVLMDGLE